MDHRTLSSSEARGRAAGTGQLGIVHADFGQLVEEFGEPLVDPGDKTRREWVVLFDDGVVATIYDFVPEHGHVPAEKVVEWHVGGARPESLAHVYAAMDRSPCCGATTTFHDDLLCCKACWAEVPCAG